MRLLGGLLLVVLLSACQHRPAQRPRLNTEPLPTDTTPLPSEDAAPPSNVDLPTQSLADAPPCLPVDANTKISPRPRRTVVRTAPPPPPEPAPAQPAAVEEASIKPVENLSMPVLGKKVHGPQGEDYGRVVDILADGTGRVRVAILEFGGFLGVGLRRVAIDWSLLKFRPATPDSPWLLDVVPQKLQGIPEYKDSGRPSVLMAPTAAMAPAGSALPAADPKK